MWLDYNLWSLHIVLFTTCSQFPSNPNTSSHPRCLFFLNSTHYSSKCSRKFLFIFKRTRPIVSQCSVLWGRWGLKQWSVFKKRPPVTMDLLCVFVLRWPLFSVWCVSCCCSLLESIWVLGFGHVHPCQEQYSIPSWPGFSAGTSLSHQDLARLNDQLNETVQTPKRTL